MTAALGRNVKSVQTVKAKDVKSETVGLTKKQRHAKSSFANALSS